MAKKSTRSPEAEIAAQALAAKTLREVLGSDANDAELFHDMVEGETSLFEMIDAIYDSISADQEIIDGIDKRVANLKARQSRVEERIGWRRAKIEAALMVYGDKIERPEATFFLSNRAPSVIITDEAMIPAKYFVQGDPKLDKKLLKKDLDAIPQRLAEELAKPEDERLPVEEIPGATLSNGFQSLNIRVA
jgi:hypothetical protein